MPSRPIPSFRNTPWHSVATVFHEERREEKGKYQEEAALELSSSSGYIKLLFTEDQGREKHLSFAALDSESD